MFIERCNVPALALDGLLTRTEGTKIKVATGECNKAIDARIAEIKQACPVEQSSN